ncbi:MAG: 50S ribosomal protein L40e [Methanobacteriota archaeon]|nr:MAG: 50S ribosomal protein L40e [Euryarchaeota archaeon]
MAKFPEPEKEINDVLICMRCKARNSKTAKACRKCGAIYLRKKRKQAKAK